MTDCPVDPQGRASRRNPLGVRLTSLLLIGSGLSLAVDACCEDYELGVGDLDGRMSFGADVALDADFDWDKEITWDSSSDFSSWGHLSVAADGKVGFDTEDLLAFEATRDVDIDDDGVDEPVKFVGFAEEEPGDPKVVFASWRGDKYSFDSGTCYLLWSDGSTVEMLSGPCVEAGEEGVVLSCTLEASSSGRFGCDACVAAGKCVSCSKGQSVSSCMNRGESELEGSSPNVGGAGGASSGASDALDGGRSGLAGSSSEGGSSPGGAGGKGGLGAGGSAPGGTGGTPASGGSAPVGTGGTPNPGGPSTEEWEACLSLAGLLGEAGNLCGLNKAASAEVLCTNRLDEVSECYAAFDAVGLFENPCAVLSSAIACGSILE